MEYVLKGLIVIQRKNHRQLNLHLSTNLASIEKVVSEAAIKGIDKEVVLDGIEHLKIRGEAYEPKNGEIKYVF